MLSSNIRLQAGFASAHRLMLMGLFNTALSRQRLTFMVTTEEEALQSLDATRPGLLIATQQLEQGSGLALVEQARSLVHDIRTILILDSPHDDLVAAGLSVADAVMHDAECFGNDQPVVTMVRALAVGQRYRSPAVVAAMKAAAVQRDPWRDAPPDLTGRELELMELLVQGLGDREIAGRLMISYETARSRGKALQLGLARLGTR